MGQVTPESLDGLRESWAREWLRAWSGPADRRAAMLDRYAELHATSHLLATTPHEATHDLDDPLGRALTARIVRRILPAGGPFGHVLPVLAAPGEKPLRVERSRPDWHLNGTVEGVAWDQDVELLAVFAVDEGDNDVLALIAPGTPGVGVTRVGQARADIRLDDVRLPAVTHCPGQPAVLADGLTVLAMAEAIDTMDRSGDDADLQLCRAALRAAAVSLDSPSSVRRQHDVSAAALVVFGASARLDWHRERLVALV